MPSPGRRELGYALTLGLNGSKGAGQVNGSVRRIAGAPRSTYFNLRSQRDWAFMAALLRRNPSISLGKVLRPPQRLKITPVEALFALSGIA